MLEIKQSPIEGNWFITPHAIQRYQEIQYHRPRLSQEKARQELIEESLKAKPLRQLNETTWLFRGAKPLRLRFMVSFEVSEENPMPQLITVIPRTEADKERIPRYQELKRETLKITAHMGNAIAVFDDWSPAFDSLLTLLIAEKSGIYIPNPTPEQVEETRELIEKSMPLDKGNIRDEWYWKVSSPCYTVVSEYSDRFRKRWDNHENNLNWGKRKPKFQTSEGAEKSYDLPLYCRNTPSISWYAVGDRYKLQDLLQACTHLGKKRSYGNGLVTRWEVTPTPEDWHLWKDGNLMRPMPARIIPPEAFPNPVLMNWGWRPPAWLHTNKELCIMPVSCVSRMGVEVGSR